MRGLSGGVFRLFVLSAPKATMSSGAVGTFIQYLLASGYTLGNLSAAHPNGRFRPKADNNHSTAFGLGLC
jgi:hypothetical protein